MSIKSNKIIVDNHIEYETLVAIYYEGNKLEVAYNRKTLFYWSDEFDTFEKWLKIEVDEQSNLDKFLKCEITLFDIIKNHSNLEIFNRYFEKYNTLNDGEKVDYDYLLKVEYDLPDEDSFMIYDFYDKYIKSKKNERYEFSYSLKKEYNKWKSLYQDNIRDDFFHTKTKPISLELKETVEASYYKKIIDSNKKNIPDIKICKVKESIPSNYTYNSSYNVKEVA